MVQQYFLCKDLWFFRVTVINDESLTAICQSAQFSGVFIKNVLNLG